MSIEDKLDILIKKRCLELAEDITDEMKRGWSSTKSSAGEPPARASGELERSISSEATATGAEVNIDAPYAAMLEYGTSEMAARPFARPAMMVSLAKLTNEGIGWQS